jgi:hypothetical protein
MRLCVIALAAMMAFAMMPVAYAAPLETGNDILRDCSRTNKKINYFAHCAGFIRGLADGIMFWEEYHPETVVACIPPRADTGQLSDIVLRWLADNPKMRHLGSSVVVALALHEAWPGPCKRKAQ